MTRSCPAGTVKVPEPKPPDIVMSRRIEKGARSSYPATVAALGSAAALGAEYAAIEQAATTVETSPENRMSVRFMRELL
jgi:hypothetical protein